MGSQPFSNPGACYAHAQCILPSPSRHKARCSRLSHPDPPSQALCARGARVGRALMPRAVLLLLCCLALLPCSGAAGAEGGAAARRLLAVTPPPPPLPPPSPSGVTPSSAVTLRVNTTNVTTSGSWVAVTWAFPASGGGGPSPSTTDVIALFVPPPGANLAAAVPVKFMNVSGARSGTVKCVPYHTAGNRARTIATSSQCMRLSQGLSIDAFTPSAHTASDC